MFVCNVAHLEIRNRTNRRYKSDRTNDLLWDVDKDEIARWTCNIFYVYILHSETWKLNIDEKL